MSKPFKNLDEQINILKTRNLTIIDDAHAKECLLQNNYYNVVNCYGKFLTNSSDRYINGSEFKEMMAIHTFDREFKKILFVNTQIIENYFKSILAYNFSFKGTRVKYAYFDQSNYDPIKVLETARLCGEISKIIENETHKRDSAIYHYFNQHGDVPIWVLVNYMTFGQVIKMYKVLRIDIKNEINKNINIFANKNLNCTNIRLSDTELVNILDNIKNMRNIVAHNNKLFDYKARYNYPYISQIHSSSQISPSSIRKSVFDTFMMMKLFLNNDQFKIMNNSIVNRMKNLDKRVHSISINNIISKLGYPQDWYKISKII